jgi:AmmeMemoRadiSam system protein B
MIRTPAVAGQFYLASPEKLKQQVEACMIDIPVKEKAIAVVAPHAGLMYSGKVAGKVYSRLILPRTFIMVGPNHTGLGAPVSVFSKGKWQMPQGKVAIEEAMADKILERFPDAEPDVQAHQSEHCLEVHLPFLQFLRNEVRIVPIIIMRSDLLTCQELGLAIASTLREWPEPVLLIASTDMTHYESDQIARHKDSQAIQKILALDPEGLYHTVRQQRISMCGVAPTVSVLFASSELGASRAELVHYMTSAEASGDFEHVVGYAGIIIK